MDSNAHFSIITFTDVTKKVCTCSAISIFLIVLFIISPLSNFFLTSVFMKIITLIILFYTIYLNNEQTNYLQNASQLKQSIQVNSQLKINIICSHIFTLFIGLLIIFVIKSFFYI
jgi:hypothetical protein